MKKTSKPGTEKTSSLWKNLTSGILDKVNIDRNSISETQNKAGDMGDTHTPISRLDLTGMNREQAKEMIGKIIDEKLEMISHIEMTELQIDQKERERQRAKAAERITERRNKRKSKGTVPTETIITEQGVYSDFKHTSVFDVLQPETFPYEEYPSAPIEGQLSLLDMIADKSSRIEEITEFAPSLEPEPDMTISQKQSDMTAPVTAASDNAYQNVQITAESEADDEILMQEIMDILEPSVKVKAMEAPEKNAIEVPGPSLEPEISRENHVNTSLDQAVDRIFVFFDRSKIKIVHLVQKLSEIIEDAVHGKILPAAVLLFSRVNGKLIPVLLRIEARLQLKSRSAAVYAALSQGEKRASEKMVLAVDFLDRKNDALIRGTVIIKEKLHRAVNTARDYAERHKKMLLIEFGAGVAVIAAVTMVIGSMTAYEYIYNGKVLGLVKNQDDVYKTVDIIGDKLSVQYDADIFIDKEKDIRFKKVIAFNQNVDDKEDILNRLTYMRDMKANGRGIYVNGKLAAVLESDKSAKEILDEIKDKYVKKDANIQYKKVDFAEDVTIKDVQTKLGDIETKDKALEYMLTGAVAKQIHVVQSGETFSEIAKMYGLKQSELQVSNPSVIPEKLQIGQEICLNQIVPLVTVQTTELAQYKETIPYEIKYENTGNLYKNEKTVKSKGANGEKDVVAEIVRNNGIEVSRNEISSTIISQPVSQVVMVGTKEPPPLIGTGSFIYPIRGTLTSRYGYRWGRLHAGIDLAAPIGTAIKAADGGLVTFAGYNGELGYMVAIDHGGGKVTWYGHCSKLIVKKGERVYQGQHIANVGNTGHSTGPHVHFEVHINGKTKNPLNYL